MTVFWGKRQRERENLKNGPEITTNHQSVPTFVKTQNLIIIVRTLKTISDFSPVSIIPTQQVVQMCDGWKMTTNHQTFSLIEYQIKMIDNQIKKWKKQNKNSLNLSWTWHEQKVLELVQTRLQSVVLRHSKDTRSNVEKRSFLKVWSILFEEAVIWTFRSDFQFRSSHQQNAQKEEKYSVLF
jgi:hypothetical protein